MLEKLGVKAIRIIGFVLIFVFSFIFFVYITFPSEKLKDRVISEIESGSSYGAVVKSINLKPVLGLDFQDVEIYEAKKRIVKIDSLKLRPSLTSVFSNNLNIPFRAKIGTGNIEGALQYNKESKAPDSLEVNLANVDAVLISSFFDPKIGAPKFRGRIDGNLELYFSNRDGVKIEKGSYSFYSNGFSISDIRINKIPLPNYENLQASLKGKLDRRLTSLDEMELKNSDFDLKLSGTMPHPWNLKKGGKLDLSYKLLLFSKDAKFSVLKAVASVQKDGSYIGQILGTVARPRFVGAQKARF